MLSKADNKTSNQSLGRNRADSAPKLNHSNLKNISQPALEGVVLEVSNHPPHPSYPLSFFKLSPTVCVCVCASMIAVNCFDLCFAAAAAAARQFKARNAQQLLLPIIF